MTIWNGLRSGLALGLDERGGDRFLGGLAGPEDELEDRVEALAFLDRRLDQGLGMLEGEDSAFLALEQGGVAEEDQAGRGPELKWPIQSCSLIRPIVS